MWDCGAGAGRQRNRGSNLRRRPADRHPPLARFADRRALKRENEELQRALAEVQNLKGLISICGWCKRIRDDRGYWEAVESFISGRTAATFTHGVCPE